MPSEVADLHIRVISDQVKQAEKRLDRLEKQGRLTEKATDGLTKKSRFMNAAFLAGVGSIGLLTVGLTKYSRAIISADKANTRIRNSLTFVTGSLEATNEEMDFLTRRAYRYGQDLQVLASQYSKFAAAAKGTSLEGEESRLVLEGMSSAAASLGLDAEQVEGAMRALEQIMSKGTVQAEELRGQLGERIPGAFQIASRAMGVTTQQLNKMLEQGQVLAEDFLPKFSRELIKTFGGDIDKKTDNLTGATNRLNTALFELFTDDRNNLANSFKETINSITDLIKDPEFQSSLAAFSSFIGNTLVGAGEAFRDVMQFPRNFKTVALGLEAERINEKMIAATDPAEKARLLAILKGYQEEIRALSFSQPEEGQDWGDIGIPSIKGGGSGNSVTQADLDKNSKIRNRGLGFFEDDRGRLERLKAQYYEEREFLKANREIVFNSEAEFQERLYQLQVQYTGKRVEIESEAAKRRLDNQEEIYDRISNLAYSSDKRLATIGKAAAIRNAIINTKEGATKALAAFPPPLNYVMMAGVLAEGYSQIQAIRNAGSFTNGINNGFVGGNSYSGDRMTADVNSGEAILNPHQQRQFIALANGKGGSVGRVEVRVENYGVQTQITETQGPDGQTIVAMVNKAVKASEANTVRQVTTRQGPIGRALESRLKGGK